MRPLQHCLIKIVLTYPVILYKQHMMEIMVPYLTGRQYFAILLLVRYKIGVKKNGEMPNEEVETVHTLHRVTCSDKGNDF